MFCLTWFYKTKRVASLFKKRHFDKQWCFVLPFSEKKYEQNSFGQSEKQFGKEDCCVLFPDHLLAPYIWIRYLVLIYMPRLYCSNCTSSVKLYKLSSINTTILVFKYFYQNNTFMLGKENNLTTITYLCTITTAGTAGSVQLLQKAKEISALTKILILSTKLCVDHLWCFTFPPIYKSLLVLTWQGCGALIPICNRASQSLHERCQGLFLASHRAFLSL